MNISLLQQTTSQAAENTTNRNSITSMQINVSTEDVEKVEKKSGDRITLSAEALSRASEMQKEGTTLNIAQNKESDDSESAMPGSPEYIQEQIKKIKEKIKALQKQIASIMSSNMPAEAKKTMTASLNQQVSALNASLMQLNKQLTEAQNAEAKASGGSGAGSSPASIAGRSLT